MESSRGAKNLKALGIEPPKITNQGLPSPKKPKRTYHYESDNSVSSLSSLTESEQRLLFNEDSCLEPTDTFITPSANGSVKDSSLVGASHENNQPKEKPCRGSLKWVPQTSTRSPRAKRSLWPETSKNQQANALKFVGDNGGTSKIRRVVMDVGNDDELPAFYLETDDSDDNFDTMSANDSMHSSDKADEVETPLHADEAFPKNKKRACKPRVNARKRIHEPSQKKEREKLYRAGKEYITANGKKKPAREMGAACKASCNRCKPRITDDERKKNFEEFWNLKHNREKWDYISRRVKSNTPKSVNTLPENAKKSIKTYSLRVGNTERRVCKNMFLNTLGINHSWVDTALSKVTEKGSITPDKRGGHHNRPSRNTEEAKQSCRDHINMIERVPSHFCRARSKREYFEHGLTFERLFKMYQKWAEDEKLQLVATKSCYYNIFVTEFNIGFHAPLSDQCLIHAQWRNASEEERRDMQYVYEKHIRLHNALKKIKKEEKAAAETDKTLCVCCFDLEKVLTCPKSAISVMFYKTKLSLYNFTVFDLQALLGQCYLWDETIGNRGADEIASNLFMFVRDKVDRGIKTFSMYSDSPTGQNRNRMVFALWLLLAIRFEISITHRFFEIGHSFSEVDSMHGRIETESRGKELFHPDEWVELILNAKQNGETYQVTRVTQEHIFNFHDLVDNLHWKKDTDGEKVSWSTVRHIRVDHQTPDRIFFKYDFDQIEKEIVVNPARNKFDISSYQLKQAYSALIPLKEKKAQDLKFLLKQRIIPRKHIPFYKRLINDENMEDAAENEEVDNPE